MTLAIEIFNILLPYLFLVVLILLMARMLKGAKAGKMAAVAFGVLVQMFSPDPEFEKKVKIVQVAKQKQQQVKQQAGEGEPDKAQDQVQV